MNIETIASTAIRSSPVTEAPPREPQRVHQPAQPNSEPEAAHQPEIDAEKLAQAVEGVNSFLASSNNHIQFAMHEGAGRMMVQVIDDRTDEVIRTFPSKELLDLAGKIGELVGTLLDEKG